MKTRNAVGPNGVIIVSEIEEPFCLKGVWFFGAGHPLWSITEMSTGFALPDCTCRVEAEEFMQGKTEEEVAEVLEKAKEMLKNMGIEYPVNKGEEDEK